MHITAVQGSGGLLLSWYQEAFKMHNAFAKEDGYVWKGNLSSLDYNVPSAWFMLLMIIKTDGWYGINLEESDPLQQHLW